ncbi:MAG: glutathione S-transferase family protein [Gammaproteobacteria bacterium]|nr:glutathione S-transferase family protein [Gammaproteobacteria bacterium]
MKLYTWGQAPNPRRVKMFLAEKGIELPAIDVGDGPQLSAEFLARSSHRSVPMLELDDGMLLGEVPAICRYLESQYPAPPLLGSNPRAAAMIEMWERIGELQGIQAVGEVFRNTAPAFAGRGLAGYAQEIGQIPALAERGKVRFNAFLRKLDQQLSGREFVADSAFSLADITCFCAVEFGQRVLKAGLAEYPELERWHGRVRERPSATV